MRSILLFSLLFTFLISSCVKEEPEPDQEPDPGDKNPTIESLAEATIGPEGGELAADDFVLTIPEGALDTTLFLKLFLSDEGTWSDPKMVTELYRLEGLNADIKKPLEFSIRYEGDLVDENAIALGFNYYNEESGDSVRINELLSAVESEGFLKGTLAPLIVPESGKKSGYITDGLASHLLMSTQLMVSGLSKIKTYRSEYAEIRYDQVFNFSQAKVEQFAQYVDEAVYFFEAMKLIAKADLGDIRFRVNIIDPGRNDARPAFVVPDRIGDNPIITEEMLEKMFKELAKVYLISINGDYFSQADEDAMRMDAAEGVLRYYNFLFTVKMKNWLEYSVLYWVKRYFYGSYPLYSTESLSYMTLMQPYYGMNVDKTHPALFPENDDEKKAMYHGEGMSAVIAYLMDQYNDDLELLSDLYNEIIDSDLPNHPIDILLATVDTPENTWWPEFFKAYLEGRIWEIPVFRFQEKIASEDHIDFVTEADTVKYLDRMYPDLSARLFQVTFDTDFPDKALDEGDKLSIKLEPQGINLDYADVQVHFFDGSQPVLYGEGDEVVISDLKDFINSGNRTLLVTVVNSASESPYTEDLEIGLTIRVLKERTWSWKYVSFDVSADAVLMDNSGGDPTVWDEFSYAISEKELNMNVEGTLLYTSWLDQTEGYKFEGGMDITLDPVTGEITGFYAWSNSESISDGVVTLSEKTEIRGKEGMRIPIVYGDGSYLAHQVSGQAVCGAIGSWSYEHALYPGESYEYSNKLESYSCSDNSLMLFSWAKESGALKGTKQLRDHILTIQDQQDLR